MCSRTLAQAKGFYTEQADHWVIDAVSEPPPEEPVWSLSQRMRVERVCFGSGFDLRLTESGEYAEIRIAGRFALTPTSGSAKHFDLAEANAADLLPLVDLTQTWVRSCRAMATGTLEVEIEEVGVLAVSPHHDYEAWEVSADDSFVVCLPGGDVAVSEPGRSDDL